MSNESVLIAQNDTLLYRLTADQIDDLKDLVRDYQVAEVTALAAVEAADRAIARAVEAKRRMVGGFRLVYPPLRNDERMIIDIENFEIHAAPER